MNNFVSALDMAIKDKNWYSVLFISLTIPDICGKIDEPNKNSKERTINWFNKFLKPTYTAKIGSEHKEHVFLSGTDFYALRCAYLHEGSDDITPQRAREILERFVFLQSISGKSLIHRNLIGKTLQLQVDEFGKEVMHAVNSWLDKSKDDHAKMSKVDKLLKIQMIP